MAVPPELEQTIAQAKQQNPQLTTLPDEVVAQMILQAMQEQQAGLPTSDEELRNMHPEQLGAMGEQMMNIGRWDEAERYFFQAMENAERLNDIGQRAKVASL